MSVSSLEVLLFSRYVGSLRAQENISNLQDLNLVSDGVPTRDFVAGRGILRMLCFLFVNKAVGSGFAFERLARFSQNTLAPPHRLRLDVPAVAVSRSGKSLFRHALPGSALEFLLEMCLNVRKRASESNSLKSSVTAIQCDSYIASRMFVEQSGIALEIGKN